MAARINQRFDKRTLVRLATWGTSACVALMVTAVIAFSSSGSQRPGLSQDDQRPANPQMASRAPDADAEKRRLDDAIRLLAADRDRLLTRVASLERNVDDITGSIKRKAEQPPLPPLPGSRAETTVSLPEIPVDPPATVAAEPSPQPRESAEWPAKRPQAWPSASAGFEMAPLAAQPAVVASIPDAPTAPAPEPRTEADTAAPAPAIAPPPPVTAKSEFGVDIGSASTLDEARTIWRAARTQYYGLLGNLSPIVVSRKNRAGATELRIVVGPLPSAAAAAKLCMNLSAADVMCSTLPFEGQRLATR